MREILLWPDPRLSRVCAPADADDPALPALIDDLFETMYAAKGRGLAAPQIGVMQRVFVVDVAWKEGTPAPMAFVNPHLSFHDEVAHAEMEEQCLSIPDLPMPVTRPSSVQIAFIDRLGMSQDEMFEGPAARCIQHEFDHLNGRVIFDHQAPKARTEFEARYGG
nr:peptide deformylase [Hasllibacter sp. MH4015]